MSQFNRIASFVVASQIDPASNTDTETAAEIVAASTDGNTLVYSNSPQGTVGFVDITNPAAPVGLGEIAVGGEPTSVTVLGDYALVAVNTSTDFVNVSGRLLAIDISSQAILNFWELGGQPDSIAVSPDGNYVVIAIENERDEDDVATDGGLPQAPAGFVVVVDTSSPSLINWTTTTVDLTGDLTGLPGLTENTDPEPEFVDISENNIAAVTLQENNAIVLIDLATASVIRSFSADTVDLTGIDTVEEDPAIINQTGSLTAVPREPDGISFIGTDYIATADEGDWLGGSRGFTIYDLNGNIIYTSGNELDRIAAQIGHYPDARSENKGNEPENIEFATYDGTDYLFVNSERSSLVFVYNVDDPTNPVFEQVLPAGSGPEGGKAIPERNLLVVASENDSRDDVIRSVVNIYQYSDADALYPTLQSEYDGTNPPIPWGAMSGLAAGDGSILYAVEDSFYASNRFFTIDTSTTPPTIVSATTLKDTNDVFAALRPDLVNADTDKTINIDPEGIAATGDGFLWIASEGAGAAADADKILNYLFKVDATTGTIAEVITLPDEVNDKQIRFGLEGVAYDNGKLVVVLQRAWTGDANPRVLVYDTATSEWVGDYFYPLDTVESQNGGWVGLSDISPLGNNQYLVLERDNQGGPDAAIKRLYTISLVPGLQEGSTLEKTFVRNLIPDFTAAGGLMPEKLEGLAVTESGVWVINDNDGVDDNSGETQLIKLEGIINPAAAPTIGQTTALIPQAGTSTAPEHLLDGGSGDIEFPYGTFKALATVGEIDPNTGHVLTGYPDGQAAWLLDEDTIRVVYQSESYATLSNETYPWEMESGATFTGSHIHAIDYNRALFADFLNNDSAASEMFEGSGHLFDTVYNVFGEIVTGKNTDTADLAAKWGNQTGADGTVYEFDTAFQLTQADWFFHSFCGAYYEQANKYGDGIGFEDDVWLMGEEWNIGFAMYASRGGDDFFTNNTMGLASMVVDIANETAYTVPVLGQSGYEKIMPINSGHEDYVVLVMSGYNLEVEPAPLKVYIGKKDFDASGNAIDYNTASERDAFLARNGLLFGQLYGMAATDETYAALGIETVDADTEMLNAYATDADAPDTFQVRYYATDYRWDGFDTPENAGETEVYRWLQDGDNGETNEQPDGYTFFNGDSKVEHPAVDPDITQSRYVINLTDARSILGIDFNNIVTDLENDADGNGLPDYLSADVTRIVAGVDGSLTLETNGKGAAHVGPNNPDGTLTHATHVEDQQAYADQPDGLQWVKTSDGDYLIVDEDSGNDYGERKYVLPIDAETLELVDPGTGYFLASAGGSLNPRAQAGVAAIPGTFSRATSSEFSGTWNVTHLVAQKEDGSFYTQAEIAGTGAQDIIGSLPLAEQTFIGVLQHSGESGGIVAERQADQGGQIFVFNVTEPLTPPTFTLELFHAADQEPLNAGASLSDITRFSAVLNALKAEDVGNDGLPDNTLILSSGDAVIPGLFYDASEAVFGSGGIADIQIQNELGFQAIAFGNHEFDKGTAEIAGLIDGSAEGEILGSDFTGTAFPYLSTNLDFSTDANLAPLEVAGGGTPQPNTVTASVVIDVNGESIGVVGATTPTLGSISSPGDLDISPSPFGTTPTEAELDALAAEIQAEVDALLAANPDMNKVVLLAHMQRLSIEEALATRLENVDIIVGGGSNTRLFDENDRVRAGDSNQGEYPKFFTNAGGTQTVVVNTDGSYKYLGRLVIDFDVNGNIIPESYDSTVSGAYATDAQGVADLNAEGLVDPEIQAIVDAIEAQIIATESNVFGLASVFLNGNRSGQPTDGVRTQETNLGNLTADANLALAQSIDPTVVVSIKNGGGIRSSIGQTIVPPGGGEYVRVANLEVVDSDGNVVKPEGGISENDITKTLAFNNGLTLLTLTKAELVAVLDHGVSALPGVAGQFPQVAGVKFSFDENAPEGSKIQNAGIFDEADNLIAELVRDGEIVGDPDQTFRIVTLNFLAGGGDSYPFPTGESADRVDLYDLNADGIADQALTGDATFAFDGTEQDALAEYLLDNFATPETAFDQVDVTPEFDTRIQNLNFREDAVLPTLLSPENPFDTTAPAQMKGLNGYLVDPVFTVGESFSVNGKSYTPPGILDGLGAFALDEDTVRVYANHELSAGTGYAYQLANGTFLDGARVSYFDINKDTRTLEATGLAYDTVYNRAGEVVDSPDDLEAAGFDRFCSAQYIEAEQFGAGRGLVDGIFFTGEETDGGTEFALDPDTNTLYAVPWMGRAAWESVTELDTGTTDKIALLVGDDRGGAPMLLYVGDKGQGTGPEFLVRNGLASGKLYVWVATSGETTPTQFNGTGENRDGSFVAIDYYRPDLAGNGEYDELGFATQDKQDALAAEVGAFQFSRPEDLATNPVDGTQAVLASTGRDSLFPADSWGTTYIVDTDFSDLNNITANVKVIYDGDDAGAGQFAGPDFGLRSPDNLDWADDGQIYIQEDRSVGEFGLASGQEASIWRLDPSTGVLTRVAQMDRNALPDGQTDRSPTDIGNWESSGIIDVSTLFGEDPGQLFLFDVQAHSLRDGAIAKAGLVQGGQLAFLELTANRPVFAEETIAITIADDLEDGDLVGEPITATDADEGDSLTYSITGGNEDPDEDQKAAFAIDTSTGQITVNDADDLALLDVFNLTVTVTDSTGLKDTTQVTVDVSRFEETGTTGIFTISSLDVRNLVIQTINNLDINIGIFFVDDALGSIDGILPGDDGYQEAAAGRAISLLAALASTDNPNAPGQLKKVLGLKSAASLVSVQQSTDFFFGFLSVEQVSIGDLFAIVNGSSSLSLSGLKISLSTDDDGTGITSDGDGGFIFTFGGIEFSVSFNADEIEDAFGGLLGIDLNNDDVNDEIIDEVIANCQDPGTYTIRGSIFREAAFNNTIGFFLANAEGAILDSSGGVAATLDDLNNYRQAIVDNLLTNAQYQVANNTTLDFSFSITTVTTAVYVLPVLAVQGDFSSFSDIYYPVIAANSDRVDHAKFQGVSGNSRFFGFEDLPGNTGISDNDFDDFVVSVQVS